MILSRPITALRAPDQKGINMVDLMMWLVIAALLLAAALQSIGYYQKTALLYQLSSDVASAGQNAMTEVANNSGGVDSAVVAKGIAGTKKSDSSTTFTKFVYADGSFTITATSTDIEGIKVTWSSAERDGLKPGVNRVGGAGPASYPSGEGLSGFTGAEKRMLVRSGTDQCLDIAWGSAVDGNRVIYHPCNGGVNQEWLWDGDGQLKSKQNPSVCLDTNKTSKLTQLSTCSDTSGSQIFQTINSANNEFSLFQPSSNNCLKTIPDVDYPGYFRMIPTNCDDTGMTRWKYALL